MKKKEKKVEEKKVRDEECWGGKATRGKKVSHKRMTQSIRPTQRPTYGTKHVIFLTSTCE